MELLLFNESHQITYFGKCTIKVNGLNGHLNVTPTDEDFKVCPFIFKQDVIKQNTFLFVLASNLYPNDFVLIFPSIDSCNKIFEVIQKFKDPSENQAQKNFDNDSIYFEHRFFVPILDGCHSNKLSSGRIKEFLCVFLKSLKDDTNEKYHKIIKEKSVKLYSEILKRLGLGLEGSDLNIFANAIENESDKTSETEIVETTRQLRKRLRNDGAPAKPTSEMDSSSEECNNLMQINEFDSDEEFDMDDYESDFENSSHHKKRKITKYPLESVKQNMEGSNFKLFNFVTNGKNKTRLVIFLDKRKEYCHEYFVHHEKSYLCCACFTLKNRVKVIIDQEKIECIHVDDNSHICKPVKYDENKFKDDIKIFKQNYKIFDMDVKGKKTKRLIIYPFDSKNKWYEFYFDSVS